MPSKLVLLGGSAGSLAAIQRFFEASPKPCGLTYVVIQHLSPDYRSELDALIRKWVSMPVRFVEQGMPLQPDHVYVCVPGYCMVIKDHVLSLEKSELGPDRFHPIDHFCQSLAAEYGSNAALVVLSGTGHDGTLGSELIKDAGGVVIAQEIGSADFDGMPESVVSAGTVSRTLVPESMPDVLCAWSKTGQLELDTPAIEPALTGRETFDAILALVRARTHNDMGGYKTPMLHRRAERRMALNRIDSLEVYLQMLQQSPVELDLLAKDLLIGVTAFFRDPDAFKIIENEVIPAICTAKDSSELLRVWVAGCSTGEEAYSITILLMEWLEAHQMPPRIQLFATDIDDAALDVARIGYYSKDELEGLPSERIHRYFDIEENGYRIAKSVRENIVFASHNLITDPPFSKLDLVVCRNLMIYLNTATQKKLLGLFHYVLNPGGYLFLGSSENLGSLGRHFQTISKSWRIFRHIATSSIRVPSMPIASASRRMFSAVETPTEIGTIAWQDRFYRQLVEANGPAQILVNSRHEVLFVSGDTTAYLKIPVGQISLDLFKLTNPVLAFALRSAISKVRENSAQSAVNRVKVEGDGQSLIRIEVKSLSRIGQPDLMLISFNVEMDQPATQLGAGSAIQASVGGDEWLLRQLMQELNATREDLQHTLEQGRASSEEMRASNEEIMAMNEELQSANEELESSKEELQSLNEELVVSNANLDAKVIEVVSLNSDLSNLLNSTETATLLLDASLRIRRFTPACTRLMRVLESDIGRAIDDVVRLFDDPDLSQGCVATLQGQTVPDQEIQDQEHLWYLRRILPYRDSDGKISGLVLIFPEITLLKNAEKLLRERAQKLQWQSNLLTRAAPILGMDQHDRVIFWNKGAEILYGWSEEEALGKVAHELLRTQFSTPIKQIKSMLKAHDFWNGELTHLVRSGETVVVDSQWTPYRDETGKIQAIVEVNTDITERKQAQRDLRDREEMFHTMLDWTPNWEYWINPKGELIYSTPSVETITGYSLEEFSQNLGLLNSIVFADDVPLWRAHLLEHLDTESDVVAGIEFRMVRKNGTVCWVNHTCRPVVDETGVYQGRRVTVRDISAQKKAEDQIRDLAYFDVLTRLPNRRLLLDRLGQALITSHRNRQFGALLMMDLDQFKRLNDTRGHDVGDHLLVEVSQRLIACVRQEDTISRLGGDEFVVLLGELKPSEQIAAKEAVALAEKIRLVLNEPYFLGPDDAAYYISTSIGVATFTGSGNSAELLLKQADVALYQAKDAGRNLVRYFNPAMQAAIDERAEMETALQRALEEHELRLFYQPQIDHEGKTVGAEALVRWQRQDCLTPPNEFIPLAEESRLIIQIGQWVLDTACDQLVAWANDPRAAHLYLAVNVSARQFYQPDFVAQVKRCLVRSGANPKRLKLELTESVVLDQIDLVVHRMNELIELGLSFSLDDFGTGYSSLSYLKRLPLAQVKIDQSFVRDIPQDGNDASIIRAILAMNQSLGLSVIAEGVETPEQRDFLLQNGCTLYQGYLYGRPTPIEEWQKFLPQ